MRSPKLGAGIAVGALALAVALFVVLRDDDGPSPETAQTTTAEETASDPGDRNGEPQDGGEDGAGDDGGGEPGGPQPPTIVIRDGQPVGGVAELDFRHGGQVRFVVRSNADDEIHVHGYDITEDVVAGAATRVSFPAAIEGVFEAELHGAGTEIARIAVHP